MKVKDVSLETTKDVIDKEIRSVIEYANFCQKERNNGTILN